MSERDAFIKELVAGASMSALCRRYGISRKTGYKWRTRFMQRGLEGLEDRSRAPHRHPNETPDDVVEVILELRRRYPTWGPRKLVQWLGRHRPEVDVPCASTVGAILKRNGLVRSRARKPRPPRYAGHLTEGVEPNHVWSADFKGQFQVKNGRICWPLTISDHGTRYLLCCQGLSSSRVYMTMPVFESTFREFGLPLILRTDNGVPFCGRTPGGLTELAVYFVKLGIKLERIEPGRPDQNGRHERMHRTLKRATAKPPDASLTAQQRRFNRFRIEFNEQRPHEALGMLTPSDLYTPSPRAYPKRLRSPEYSTAQRVAKTRKSGQVSFMGRQVYVGRNLLYEYVAFRQVDESRWEVHFHHHRLGVIDLAQRRSGALRPA